MAEEANKINEYVCEQCKGRTRTINRDRGTTPFMIRCRASVSLCNNGMAQSCFYRVDQAKRPGWEWIRPTPEEFEQWIADHKQEENRNGHVQHVANGGMLLRKLDAVRLEGYGFRLRRG